MADPLTRRALNRATLDRQLLLRRHQLSPLEAVRHLAGLQAQAPQAPYLGLWTRLSGFDPLDVSRQITERSVLRAPVMRATVHMLDAADFVTFRPLFQTLMERGMKASYGRYLSGVDLGELMSLSHGYLARGPSPRLRDFRGEDGAELFDLPDAPRPGPDAPAPPRFLPEYDNLLLSHADRRRVIPHDRSIPLPPGNGAAAGTVLIDGEWNAAWKLGRANGAAVVRVNPFIPLTKAAAAAVTGEAMRLLEFLAPGSPCDVRLASGPD